MKKEIKEIINYSLDTLGMNSEDAADLVFKTGMAESGYRNLRQIGGPALGFFQVEPATIIDTMDNYVKYRTSIKTKLWALGWDEGHMEQRVVSNIALQVAFCRLKYRRDSKPLPKADDVVGQAKYWKRVYNSEHGKGTIEHFLEANGYEGHV